MDATAEGLETSGAAPRPARSGTARRVAIAGLVVVALFGLFLRVWALGRQPVTADEAVVGLMAQGILHGHFSAFYWGQRYGGGEPYVVAVVFALFGQSGFTLSLTPVLLDAVAAALVYRIGRRLFGPGVGAAAAALFWCWPLADLWQSTLEYGFRWAALDVGLGVMLVALRLADGVDSAKKRRRDWSLLGLLAGLGWWCSPEIIYFLVPVALVLLVAVANRSLVLRPLEVACALGAAVLGAAPWIGANLSGGSSLHSPAQPNPSYSGHLSVFYHHVFPMLLGLIVPVSGTALGASAVEDVAEGLAVLAGLAVLVAFVLARRALVLVAFTVIFPFAYAASPFSWYWQDGRYALYFAPVLALLTAGGVALAVERLGAMKVRVRSAPVLAAVVALGAALTCAGARDALPFRAVHVAGAPDQSWTSWSADPTGYAGAVVARLESAHLDAVIAGYWIATPVAFVARGAVAASDVVFVRDHALRDTVLSRSPAWLFTLGDRRGNADRLVGSAILDPGCAVPADRCLSPDEFAKYLREVNDPSRTIPLGDFVIIVPERPVDPTAVMKRFRVPH